MNASCDMSSVSEKFNMSDVRQMTRLVALSVVGQLANIGYEYPNETPSHVLDDMCDESLLDVISGSPDMYLMSDKFELTEDGDLAQKWQLALKCMVLTIMYHRLDLFEMSVKWEKRRDAAYEQFAAMVGLE